MALATIDQLKEYLGDLASNKDDDLLTRLVNAASNVIEAYCARTFSQTTYTELYDGTGTDVLNLRHFPILTVSALLEGGASLTTGTDPAASPDTLIYAEEGQLVRPYFRFLPYRRWYSVTYQAGYTTLPAGIIQACVETAALMLKQKEHTGLQAKTTGTQSATYITALSEYSRQTVDMYRNAVLGRP